MVKLKICANLSWMFKEVPFLDRYQKAADNGFSGVEVAFPYEFSLPEIIKAKEDANVEQVLINSGSASTLGNAGNSMDLKLFRDELDLAIKYANGLRCKRIHLMAGNVPEKSSKQKAQETFVENLKYASDKLKSNDIIGLVEPINSFSLPNYVLSTSMEAVDIVKHVNRDNILYQLDFFHLQTMEGNLTRKISDLFSHVGHIQVSQVPKRNEPSAEGEIQYSYIFQLLEEKGYSGWIGGEYNPTTSTVDSLKWFNDYMSI